MGQFNAQKSSSSSTHDKRGKTKSLCLKGSPSSTSRHPSWKMVNTALSKPSLVCTIVIKDELKKKRRTVSPTPNIAPSTYETKPKQEIPKKITRSGVYFQNQEISDVRQHPALMKYNPFVVASVPEMPIGMPLAKPPRLKFTKPLAKPPRFELTKQDLFSVVSNSKTNQIEPTDTNETSSQPRKEPLRKRKSGVMENEEGPSRETRPRKKTISISRKALSKDEGLFLEAAILLSVSKVSTSLGKQNNYLRLSEQAMPPPTQQLPFSQGIAALRDGRI